MGWSIGINSNDRDVGYGVPAYCDHPQCNAEIDRGISYICGGEPDGGEEGCGLFFCAKHQVGRHQRCERCVRDNDPFPEKADHPRWLAWKLNDESWAQWRKENPKAVAAARAALAK